MKIRTIARRLKGIYWKRKLKHLGNGVIFGKDITIDYPEKVSIGNRVSLNKGVYIGGKGSIIIGNNCHISPYAQIHSGKLNSELVHIYQPVVIGDNVWIASGAVISCGVNIGNNVIIGANVVVTKDIPQNTKYLG